VGANLQLSQEEIRLVTDPAWILTKNSVMEKVVRMMARLSEAYREIWSAEWSARMGGAGEGVGGGAGWRGADGSGIAGAGSPKISRGENYQGLPWVMLDYPRVFGREDVLAIRTMFWWGNAFILTLHLKGRYREFFLPALERDWAGLAGMGFHVGIADDEWRHEHAQETYSPLTGGKDLATGLPFLKLSAALTVDRWEESMEILSAWFAAMARTLASCPAGERGLSPGSSTAGSDL